MAIYVVRNVEKSTPDYLSPEFGYWFSGFFDGEGHFQTETQVRTSRYSRTFTCGIQIALRADDLPVLEYIQTVFSGGHINMITQCNWHKCQFRMAKQVDIWKKVVPLFDLFPLRSKKVKEYPIWREIASLNFERAVRRRSGAKISGEGQYLRQSITEEEWERMKKLNMEIRAMRKYGAS